MLTFQDFEEVKNKNSEKEIINFIASAISEHRSSDDFKIATLADDYVAQTGRNIESIIKVLFVHDKYSTKPIVSDFFYNLNIQRCAYSLGNGITFSNKETKSKLGKKADNKIFEAGYYALIHKYSFLFLNYDVLEMFKLTEFVPLVDEDTGDLRAGIRFWQLEEGKPVNVTLYEEDGYTKYKSESGYSNFMVVVEKTPYKQKYTTSKAFGERITGGENYSALPIVKVYGTRKQQSTLIGLQAKIDMFDLAQSGFADNVATIQQIYWLFENAGGMKPEDFQEFRNNLLFHKAANVNSVLNGAKVTPHQMPVPTEAHKECLQTLRSNIYEDFGALDVHTIAAGATNDHIDAAYQPMDLRADDFEYQIIDAVEQLLALVGIEGEEATPIFSRNKISNQKEYTEMLLLAAEYLDDETILKKLPFLTPDEWEDIKKRKANIDLERLGGDTIDTEAGGL